MLVQIANHMLEEPHLLAIRMRFDPIVHQHQDKERNNLRFAQGLVLAQGTQMTRE